MDVSRLSVRVEVSVRKGFPVTVSFVLPVLLKIVLARPVLAVHRKGPYGAWTRQTPFLKGRREFGVRYPSGKEDGTV